MMERNVYFDLLEKLKFLTKQLDASILAHANASQVRVFWCDYCGGGHANIYCVQARYIGETHYDINHQKSDPYLNNDNSWWVIIQILNGVTLNFKILIKNNS